MWTPAVHNELPLFPSQDFAYKPPAESGLKKLNADHIRFVLDSLAENTAPVRNMKQYLLAMLYNAPTTMNLYYQNKTNHDFARGSPKAG